MNADELRFYVLDQLQGIISVEEMADLLICEPTKTSIEKQLGVMGVIGSVQFGYVHLRYSPKISLANKWNSNMPFVYSTGTNTNKAMYRTAYSQAIKMGNITA